MGSDSIKRSSDKRDNKTSKNSMKKFIKKLGAAFVVGTIGVATLGSMTGANVRESTQYGRMMAISSVNADVLCDDCTLELDSSVSRISYDDMITTQYEAVQLANIEKTEKNYEAVLLAEKKAEEQAAKDKAALAALKQQQAELTNQDNGSTTTSAPQYTVATSSGDYLGQFVVTAYCSCARCCGKSTGITASGTTATAGRTIAASSKYPFGTQMVINGNVYTVEDRGGAIGGNRIDIFFDSHDAALQFGRQTLDVYAY